MTMQTPDPISFASFPVTTFGQGRVPIDQATGFLFRSKKSDRLHLITNWHVVTGRDPDKPKESRTGAIPEILQCLVHTRQPHDVEGLEYVRLSVLAEVDIRLNAIAGNEPAWKEHPLHRYRLDVVALDVEDTFSRDRYVFNVVNDVKRFDERFTGSVMDDVFVVGYPLGLSGSRSERGAMPIYKRGSIASEPLLDHDGRPPSAHRLQDVFRHVWIASSGVAQRGLDARRKDDGRFCDRDGGELARRLLWPPVCPGAAGAPRSLRDRSRVEV